MTLLSIDIIETNGACLELWVLNTELRESLLDEATHLTHLGDTTEVPFHISHKAGYACLTEGFCHHLQGDRLTCTCGTGNESMAVSHLTSNTECSVGAVGDIQPAFFVVHSYCFLLFIVTIGTIGTIVSIGSLTQ